MVKNLDIQEFIECYTYLDYDYRPYETVLSNEGVQEKCWIHYNRLSQPILGNTGSELHYYYYDVIKDRNLT